MIIFHHCLIDFNAVRADLRQFISMVHVNFNHAYSIACPHRESPEKLAAAGD